MLQQEFAKLLQEGNPLNQNKMARHLFSLLETNSFTVRVKRIEGKEDEYYGNGILYRFTDVIDYPATEGVIPDAPQEGEEIKDYRFTDILINGIKKIPVADTNKKLTFSESNKIVTSAVIMGENGVGKSTFYGALELLGMGTMKTAEIYGISTKDYIRNCFSSVNQAQATLHTATKQISLNMESLTPNCEPAFYISEWDIREVEKMKDLGDFIFSQLGMENFRNLLNMLDKAAEKFDDSIASYHHALRESESYAAQRDKLKNLLLNHIIPNSPPDDETLKELWEKYQGNHEELVKDMMQSHSLYSKVKEQIDQNEDYTVISRIENTEDRLTQLNAIVSSLKSIFDQKIRELKQEILDPILREQLEAYLKDEKETISLAYDDNSRAITAKLLVAPFGSDESADESSKTPTNPRKYFNTFRFKMFVVSLKIALACCAKVIYRQNWPIVIDDVFSSSDFNNRSRMSEYISSLIKSYKNNPKVKDYKFQLIFFTQDDVIGEAVFKGLKNQDMNARLQRLHDYRCFGPDAIKKDDNNKKYVEVSVEIDKHISAKEKEDKVEDESEHDVGNENPSQPTSNIILPSTLFPLMIPPSPWIFMSPIFWNFKYTDLSPLISSLK